MVRNEEIPLLAQVPEDRNAYPLNNDCLVTRCIKKVVQYVQDHIFSCYVLYATSKLEKIFNDVTKIYAQTEAKYREEGQKGEIADFVPIARAYCEQVIRSYQEAERINQNLLQYTFPDGYELPDRLTTQLRFIPEMEQIIDMLNGVQSLDQLAGNIREKFEDAASNYADPDREIPMSEVKNLCGNVVQAYERSQAIAQEIHAHANGLLQQGANPNATLDFQGTPISIREDLEDMGLSAERLAAIKALFIQYGFVD